MKLEDIENDFQGQRMSIAIFTTEVLPESKLNIRESVFVRLQHFVVIVNSRCSS